MLLGKGTFVFSFGMGYKRHGSPPTINDGRKGSGNVNGIMNLLYECKCIAVVG